MPWEPSASCEIVARLFAGTMLSPRRSIGFDPNNGSTFGADALGCGANLRRLFLVGLRRVALELNRISRLQAAEAQSIVRIRQAGYDRNPLAEAGKSAAQKAHVPGHGMNARQGILHGLPGSGIEVVHGGFD